MGKKPQRTCSIQPRHRRILSVEQFTRNREAYLELAQRAHYTGNPQHKSNPGDFGLVPPRDPRPDKTLCDKVEIFTWAEAIQLLRKAFQLGFVSEAKYQNDSEWPKHVWAVTEKGHPLEAAYDGCGYHGYPLPDSSTPLFDEILKRWNDAEYE